MWLTAKKVPSWALIATVNKMTTLKIALKFDDAFRDRKFIRLNNGWMTLIMTIVSIVTPQASAWEMSTSDSWRACSSLSTFMISRVAIRQISCIYAPRLSALNGRPSLRSLESRQLGTRL